MRSVRKGLARLLRPLSVAVGLLWAGAAGATHYPPGSACYDCHAISSAKAIAGTHLIRRSARTTALGIVEGSTTIKCLFCHDTGAVVVQDRTKMKDVTDHFGSTSASKHAVKDAAAIVAGTTDYSTFTRDATKFDCLDCHPTITGFSSSVTSPGNYDIHGVDASVSTANLLGQTLIGGTPAVPVAAEAACNNALCHGGATDVTNNGYTAKKKHTFNGITLNDGATPTACTQCHGAHSSQKGTALLVLQNTSGANGAAATNDTVQPDECEVCHTQDDTLGGVPNVYEGKGHGQSTINGGSLRCVNCHSGALPHDFLRTGMNPDRFAFTQPNPLKSSLTQKNAYSICLTCHSTYDAKLHSLNSKNVGCNDCHEPHGAGTGTNVKMIRLQVPADYTSDADGSYNAATPVSDGVTGTITFVATSDYVRNTPLPATQPRGLCDNLDCHGGVILTGHTPAIYPMITYLSAAGTHTGGDITTFPYDCSTCHSHTDTKGAWQASTSCLSCHGQPPVSTATSAEGYATFGESQTPHKLHAGSAADGGYGFPCQACHAGYVDSATHNRPDRGPVTYQDVAFGATAADGQPYNPASSSPAYATGTYTCSGLYCHSNGTTRTAAGSVVWQSTTTPTNWSTVNLACSSCHGGVTGATKIATGSHTAHLALAGVTCKTCHGASIGTLGDDTTTTIADRSTHVNGLRSAAPDAAQTYLSRPVAFTHTDSSGTCGSISCHNGRNATWGAQLSCDGCHSDAADVDDYTYGNGTFATTNSTEWGYSGHGKNTGANYDVSGNGPANFVSTVPADDPEGCAFCHSFRGTADNPLVAHGVGTNPFRLANFNKLARAGAADKGWNDVCLVCHSSLSVVGYDPDGSGTVYGVRNGKDVEDAHSGTKHEPGEGGQFCWDCHDPHGDRANSTTGNVFMFQSKVALANDGAAANPYGIPTVASLKDVTFTTKTPPVAMGYYTELAGSQPHVGACQACHNPASSTPVKYWRWDGTDDPDGAGGTAAYPSTHQAGTVCTKCHAHEKKFAPSCTDCHGNSAAGNWWPDDLTTEHAAGYPNRKGDHQQHIDAIFAVNQTSLSGATTVDKKNHTCVWCHPMSAADSAFPLDGHDANAAPLATADVHRDGVNTTNFKNIAGATNSVTTGTLYTGATKSCASLDCHYRVTTPSTGTAPNVGWYNTGDVATCSNCHGYGTTGAALPNAHQAHVGTTPTDMGYPCVSCHPNWAGNTSHQDGTVDLDFTAALDPALGGPRAESYSSGTNRPVKYGGSVVTDFGTCGSFYCHGNRAGGNAANAPNWYNTDAVKGAGLGDARCGTCHGSAGRAGTNVNKAWPAVGTYSESHGEHVGSNSQPGCSACHEDDTYPTQQVGGAYVGWGTYGNPAKHVDGAVLVPSFGKAFGETRTVDYEDAATQPSYDQGLKTCADVRCHNGASTPAFNLAGGANIACGDCHGTFTTDDPTPASTTTAGSHEKHASPTDFTTCDNCHGNATYSVTNVRNASAYTATGGGGVSPGGLHQNLAVDLYINSGAGTYTENYAGAPGTGGGGVNWFSGSESPATDNGQCANSGCHGGAQPVWGSGSLANSCYSCHDTNGATVGENGGALGSPADRTPNEVDKAQYESTGHGRTSGRYGKDTVGDGNGNTAANLAPEAGCNQCHDNVAHAPQAPATDPYRLGAKATVNGTQAYSPNNVCLQAGSCHGPDLPALINHHNDNVINNSGTAYDFDVKCIDCHDPHGDSNLFMVHSKVAVDGSDSDTPKAPSSSLGVPDTTSQVVFTKDTLGSDFAHTDTSYTGPFTGICEVCHVQTRWYRGTTTGSLNGPRSGHDFTDTCTNCHAHKEGFKGGGCDGCHGFPPVPPSQTPVARTNTFQEKLENVPTGYAGGGGVHRVHVNFLWKKFDSAFDPTSASAVPGVEPDPKVLCGPCHGDAPGSATWHNNVSAGAVNQGNVDIRNRTISGFSWGTGAKYEGLDLSASASGGTAASGGTQECSNLDCHGKPDPAKQARAGDDGQSQANARAHVPESLRWTDTLPAPTDRTLDGSSPYQVKKRTVVCKWCHDETPAAVVVKNAAGTGDLYNSETGDGLPTPNVAAPYFRPLSAYSRGGHGDGNINASDDPSFVDSATAGPLATREAPLDCEACHDDTRVNGLSGGVPTVSHFPPPALTSNGHRLVNTTIENDTHSTSGLCNTCHPGSDYPDAHHPSLHKSTPTSHDVVPAPLTRPVYTNASSWTTEQNGYNPVNVSGWVGQPGDPDVYVNWWGSSGVYPSFGDSSLDPPPQPRFYGETSGAPRAILPLEQDVTGGASTNRVMCVTCHNPHGTDLFTYDPGASKHWQIPDNNMLRVRDSDNSLCNACH